MVLVESIVNACIKLYSSLPKSGKPTYEEWTVISAIVGVYNDKDIKVLSLGTGSKCIGQCAMSPKGNVLNDSHAEVIARRAFLKYLYNEILNLNEEKSSEIFYYKDNGSNCVCVKNSVKFYFVTSMLPCGDASIMPKSDFSATDSDTYGKCLENSKEENTENNLKRSHSEENINTSKKLKSNEIQKEKKEGDIHRTGAKCLSDSLIQDPHLPGVLYHSIGAVRTKPGRGDPTLSLSCSDKIAKWNAVGWQGVLLNYFIESPIYMDGIICGGGVPFSKECFDRAVNERIGRQKYIPIYQSQTAFPSIKDDKKKPSPTTIIWCAMNEEKPEISVNGFKQGVTKKNLDKKVARTSICKKELFLLFEKVVNTLPLNNKFVEDKLGLTDIIALKNITYRDLKLKALKYQNDWNVIKNKFFKVWSNKPLYLSNFTLEDDDI